MGPVPDYPMAKKKIMLIDDDPNVRHVVGDFLADKGYLICEAADGLEGLDLIPKEKPNLILLDVVMPKLNGLETLKKISELHPNVVVIILTGLNEIETAKQAIRLGACNYITKPINLETLHREFIKRILG